MDPVARTVTTSAGDTHTADYLVLAAGSQASFFKTPGAREHAFPLYSLDDAKRLRAMILDAFEEAHRDPSLIDQGALEFVVVGGGPTGVEVAGAISEIDPHGPGRGVSGRSRSATSAFGSSITVTSSSRRSRPSRTSSRHGS